MKPVIRSGFGEVSYVLGPWTDFFPTSAGFGNDASQFGVCLGTEIEGGETGAIISSIVVDSPFNIAGNNAAVPWRLVVIKGKLADDGRGGRQLPPEMQQATNGWPRVGESSLPLKVIFSKMFSANVTPNAYTGTNNPHANFVFPDKCGPSCDPGETLTVLFFPMFNETGVPGYGAANKSYASFSVWGVFDTPPGSGSVKGTAPRSIAKGQLGQ